MQWGKQEPIKDEGRLSAQMGCTGADAAETQFTQVGRVGDEPNGAMLVIGSESLWGEGQSLGGGGWWWWGGGGA